MRVDGGLPGRRPREADGFWATRESAVVHPERELQVQIRVERCKRGGDFVLRGRDGTRGVSGEGVRVSRIAFSLDSFRVDVLYYTRLYS